MIKISRKLQQANPGRTNNVPGPSGIKVWVTSMGKEPQLAEVLAEGKGNPEWGAEEGSYKNDHVTRYRNGDCHRHEYSSLFCSECLCVCFSADIFVFFSLLFPYHVA